MAVQNASIKAIPYTPVTAGLLEAMRVMLRLLGKNLSREELREAELALERSEQEAELINSRVDAIQTNLLSSQENQGGFLGLSDAVALPVGAKGKAGSAITGSRVDHVHLGVSSITNAQAAFGAIRLLGNAVTQNGSTFTIDFASALILEVPGGTVNGVNATFTITNEADWLIVFKGGRATTNGNDWTLQADNKTFIYNLGEPVPAFGGSPPAGEVQMALYSVKR